MIRYIVVDDQASDLQALVSKLKLIPNLEYVQSFQSATDALHFLEAHTIDVAFLDIEMPEMTGLDLVQKIKQPPLVVFVTSHQNFALSSYELDAVDYILKPASTDRLLLCLKKIEKIKAQIHVSSNEINQQAMHPEAFFIKERTTYIKIEYNNLLYVESQNNFVTLYMADGKKHLVLVNLKHFEEQMPTSQFIRISRTHVINRQKITAFNSQQVSLQHIHLSIGNTYAHLINEETLGMRFLKRYTN